MRVRDLELMSCAKFLAAASLLSRVGSGASQERPAMILTYVTAKVDILNQTPCFHLGLQLVGPQKCGSVASGGSGRMVCTQLIRITVILIPP